MNNGSNDSVSVEVVASVKSGSDSGGSEKGRENCTDGIDNDEGGLIDGADTDCQ